MKLKFMAPLFIAILILGARPAYADLASVFCQDEYKIPQDKEELCKSLLIGTIDTIHAYGDYCPDGKTSYGYITDTWHRLLAKRPELKKIPTAHSVKIALDELGLSYKK